MPEVSKQHLALVSLVITLGLLCTTLYGQEQRFELGLRVVAMESQWIATSSPERHQAALPIVEQAVRSFFTMQARNACRLLDKARRTLRDEAPHFSDSLAVRPNSFLVDRDAQTLEFTVEQYYPFEQPSDNSTQRSLEVRWSSTKSSIVQLLGQLPQRFEIPTANFDDGDQSLQFIFRDGEISKREVRYSIAVIRDLSERRKRLVLLHSRLADAIEKSDDSQTAELGKQLKATLIGALQLAQLLEQGSIPEQKVKLHQHLTETEASVKEFLESSRWSRVQKAGDHWIHLSLPSTNTAARVFVPHKAKGTTEAWPVVIALHGAGGNEHLFFEAYGAGLLPRLCAERGWLLVSPRVPVMTRLDLTELLQTLDILYPIHPEQCFLVGHSLGAMLSVREATEAPEKLRALALLSGGGLPRADPRPLFSIPTYIAVGDRDFGKTQGKQLYEALKELGHPKLKFEEVADCEHLMVVTDALPKVMRFFDETLQQAGTSQEDPADKGSSKGAGATAADTLAGSTTQTTKEWLTYSPPTKSLAGKPPQHIVLITGDEEYRSEEAMPQLARILTFHHGFRCTVLFAIDANDGTINPDNSHNIPGLESLESADLMVIFTRFRDLPDSQMKHIVQYVESGRPIIGLRTATHAFNIPEGKRYSHYSFNSKVWKQGFGRQILGETWVNHHGHHGRESTRGVPAPGQEKHALLRGVSDVWGPTDVYGVRLPLPEGCEPVLLGQVLDGMTAQSEAVEGTKNSPMMPVAWTRILTQPGATQPTRIFTTTMGASQDLLSEGLRRLLVNACYWAIGRQVPDSANVTIVGEYKPTAFGFRSFTKGISPQDLTWPKNTSSRPKTP